MSRELPDKPNFPFLQKEAKQLLRSARYGKLAEAQHALANEYGFKTWATLKAHVESLGQSPAYALQAAVCDSDASRVRVLLENNPALRAKINNPLPSYGFGAECVVRGRHNEATGRPSMCSCTPALTSTNDRTGGLAVSV